jgi:hypothetical protein
MEMIETVPEIGGYLMRPAPRVEATGARIGKSCTGTSLLRGAYLVHIVGGGGRGRARGGVACKEAMKLLGSWCWTACCLYNTMEFQMSVLCQRDAKSRTVPFDHVAAHKGKRCQ